MKAFNREVTVVVCYNPTLLEGQMQGININKEKVANKLAILQQNLIKRANGDICKGPKPIEASVQAKVNKILSVEYMNRIFNTKITSDKGFVFLDYFEDNAALEKIQQEELGKTVLFTDRDDLGNEEIIGAYRSAWRIEEAFKQLKEVDHLTVKPMFHWTDEKIRVHIFTCVLAFRLCCLLKKELKMKDINITINQLLNEMKEVRQVTTFFGDINKPEKVFSFSKGSEFAENILKEYQLVEKYQVR